VIDLAFFRALTTGTRSSKQTLVVAKKFQAGDIFMISGTSSLDSNRL